MSETLLVPPPVPVVDEGGESSRRDGRVPPAGLGGEEVPGSSAAALRKRPFSQWAARLGNVWGPYRTSLEILALAVLFFTLLRVVLLCWFVDFSQVQAGEMAWAFWLGLRFDLLAGLCFILPQVLHITLVSQQRRVAGCISRLLLEGGMLIGLLLLPFLSIAEFLFFDEFQSRFNYIAFEYLVYPTEVCCNIWQSYPLVPLLSAVAMTGGGLYWALRRRFLNQLQQPMTVMRRFGVLALLLTLGGGLWWTSDQQETRFSKNRVLNEVAGNGWYSFVYYAWTCRFDYADFYLTIAPPEAVRRVKETLAAQPAVWYVGSSNPFDRLVHTGGSRRDWNVVLILEESFGSDFVGVLGDNRHLTPHFNRLTREGLLFDNFYATGNRTARALEAVLCSFPPIPTESILKRDHSQRVYTLAHVLAQRGYNRLFMTGGTGLFDGVRSFMTANGFNRFREQKDYHNPVFTNAWGVSDEDLFDNALVEFDRLHDEGRPFFAVVLTVSNHRPYTFPPGRVDEPGGSRRHGVKYADWALGQFFRRAKQHAFYRHTLFVVMGDHGARVYGAQLFPLKSYRVPVLMILPEGRQAGKRCHTLGCSMDVAPTILGLLGGSYRSVFFGRDLLQLDPEKGFALMQHNHDLALLNARRQMCVLGPKKTAAGFFWNGSRGELKSTGAPDPEMLQKAVGFFQSANVLYYQNRWYPGF